MGHENCKNCNGVLVSNMMNHHMGRDDEVDCSHDGRKSGPMMR